MSHAFDALCLRCRSEDEQPSLYAQQLTYGRGKRVIQSDRSCGYKLCRARTRLGGRFESGILDESPRKNEPANCLAEECGLPHPGLDHRQGSLRMENLEWNGGRTATRPEIEPGNGIAWEMT